MVIRLKSAINEDKPLTFVPRKRRALSLELENSDIYPHNRIDAPIANLPANPRVEPSSEPSYLDESPPNTSPIVKPKVRKWTEKSAEEMTDRDWRAMRSDLQIKSSEPITPLLKWSELALPHTVLRLLEQKYSKPTPVQRASVKLAMDGRDCIAVAPTGSGKTLAFVLPFLIKSGNGLVLAPTRELALQTVDVVGLVAPDLPCVALVGGHDINEQREMLGNWRGGLIVATPGRLLDFVDHHAFNLRSTNYVVLDEADRMLDLGFEPQLAAILAQLPAKAHRQTMLFSATWPQAVQSFAGSILKGDFIKLEIVRAKPNVKQEVVWIESAADKLPVLLKLLKQQSRHSAIVFVSTKISVDVLTNQLEQGGVRAAGLHGGMQQDARESALSKLRARKIQCLVATDVAARGVDVPAVSLVVNYDLPGVAETYVHRIGRTGRGDSGGRAVSLVMEKDRILFPEIRKQLLASNCTIPQFIRE